MLNLKSKIAAGIALAVLASYAAVGAFAAPGITPWPDLTLDASGHATLPDLPDEAGVSDEANLPELPAQAGGPENPGAPDGVGRPEDAPEGAPFGLQPEPAADLGVPADSPACDRFGCAVAELPNGLMIHLPQPAVDGIGQAQQNAPLGPPEGLPDSAPFGPPEGLPDSAPLGPPGGLPDAAPDSAPFGPHSDVPLGPPAGVPQP
ncbi:MAG: hypothetical protein IH958_00455 [Chloroflexi bacterium]|nr:hypothetical protein [Chloroflexota bacterium]